MITKGKNNVLIFYWILSTYSWRKCEEISLYVDSNLGPDDKQKTFSLFSISWLLTVVKPFRIPLFFHFLQNQESWMWQNWDILYHLFLVSVQVSWRLKKGHQSLCLIGFMDLSLLESIMRVTFSQMSIIYSCQGFICCPFNWSVCNIFSKVSARGELTKWVSVTSKLLLSAG